MDWCASCASSSRRRDRPEACRARAGAGLPLLLALAGCSATDPGGEAAAADIAGALRTGPDRRGVPDAGAHRRPAGRRRPARARAGRHPPARKSPATARSIRREGPGALAAARRRRHAALPGRRSVTAGRAGTRPATTPGSATASRSSAAKMPFRSSPGGGPEAARSTASWPSGLPRQLGADHALPARRARPPADPQSGRAPAPAHRLDHRRRPRHPPGRRQRHRNHRDGAARAAHGAHRHAGPAALDAPAAGARHSPGAASSHPVPLHQHRVRGRHRCGSARCRRPTPSSSTPTGR